MTGELVYVVGPLGSAEQALRAAQVLIEAGHLAVFKLSDGWSEMDAQRVAACWCVLRLPGESRAADLAVDRAQVLGVPVYHELADCLAALPIGKPEGAC